MHTLVPVFILEQFRRGCFRGTFSATSLYVDISGFTAITEGLLHYGSESAEGLNDALQAIFEPLVRSVYDQVGFIPSFGGDGFTALFPESTPHRALAAAWAIRQHVAAAPRYTTRYGSFTFAVRLGLAEGEVEWGIVPARAAQRDGQQSSYYFRGAAIDLAVRAQQYARAGDIMLTRAAYDALADVRIAARPIGSFLRLMALRGGGLPQPQPVDPPPPDLAAAEVFFPQELLCHPLRGEFRHVLSLFIELEGRPFYEELSRFMGLLNQLQAEYGGYLCRIDFADKGSSLVLFWGAPSSYEDDLERALNFILDLQAASPLRLRAGLTYGQMYAGFAGSPLREEYTCYGRWVNLAARLMGAASWGGIWLDTLSARRASANFRVELVEHCIFKGFAESVPAYVLLGRRQPRLPPPFYSPLVGRTRELERLRVAVAPLLAGRNAGLIVICGDPGTGKSRLLYEFQQRYWSHSANAVTWFRCQLDKNVRRSLNPLRDALKRYFRQSTSLSEAENKARFDQQMDALIAQLSNARLAQKLARLRSAIGALVDLHWAGSFYEQLQPQLRFAHTIEGLTALFEAESSQRPVILTLEDVHFMDVASLEFVRSLLHAAANAPIAVLASGRLKPEAHRLLGADVRQVIELQPLPASDLRLLAEGLLARRTAPQLIERVMRHTDGNPFFAEQMLLYARTHGLLVEAEDGLALADIDALIPTDTHALLIARLDRLPQEVKEVIQTAAVLGREFEPAVLARMLADDAQLEAKIQRAEREGIWAQLTSGRYLFKNALMREAAYEMQLWARRVHLHRLAAEALEAHYNERLHSVYGELAHHYAQANFPQQALWYLAKAGEQALSAGAYQEAVNTLSRVLALDDVTALASVGQTVPGARTPEMRARRAYWERLLGETYLHLGDLQRSRAHLEQALILRGRPVPQHSAGLLRQILRQGLRRICPPLFAARRSSRTPAASQQLLEAARTYERLGEVCYRAHDKGPGLHAVVQALNLAESVGPSPELARYYANICLAAGLVPFHRIAEHYGRLAQRTARIVDHLPTMSWVLFVTAVYKIGVGHWSAAREALEQAIAISDQLADQRLLDESRASLAWMLHYQGQFDASMRMFAEVSRSGHQRGDLQAQGWGLGGQAQNLWRLGRIDAAVSLLEQRTTLLSKHVERAVPAIASHGLLAAARLRQGEMLLAHEEAGRTLKMIHQSAPVEMASLDGYSGVVSVYLTLWEMRYGRSRAEREAVVQGARSACAALRRYAQIFPIGQPRAWLLRGMYQWLAGRQSCAQRAWRKSLAAAERLGMPYEQGLTHLEIGRRSDGIERREHLACAMEVFERLGATEDLAQVSKLHP